VLLTEDSDPLKTYVLADRGRLVQVIFNLLENAAQHSRVDEQIIIHISDNGAAASSNPMATIRISDAGSGIPPEYLDQVFDPFYTGRRGGTGLGLALVKHFIEDMGGSVVLYNNDPPPGCSAEVYIPLTTEKQT
jgi:signal transduction histidine kinase